MENFNQYLNEKIEDININEQNNIDREKNFNNYVAFNWYVDEKLSLLENLGG